MLPVAANQLAVAQTFTTLYTFAGYPDDGANPQAGPVMNSQGNLYGTTSSGGPNCVTGCGVIFGLSSTGVETILYSFTEGGEPIAPLILDAEGNLYGTTSIPVGSMFKMTTLGVETVLHNFTGTDGGDPRGALLRDKKGNLYGTADEGGSDACFMGYGCGTAFELSSDGAFSVLHIFAGSPSDGSYPFAGLVRDPHGNLYGTTSSGGSSYPYCEREGCGTVFEISSSGVETVLYNFGINIQQTDGSSPGGALVRDYEGNLYGTTSSGGASTACVGGCGTVFELTPAGVETVLYSFSGKDGSSPYSTLLKLKGKFYGTTNTGGAYGYGTVFELTKKGKEKVLHSFTGGVDGAFPTGTLVSDKLGNLYGTTYGGGDPICPAGYGCGTVFKVTP